MKVFRLTLLVSVLLLVGGFFCPPMGVIDGSVLSAVGLLLLFAVIDKLPEAIRQGRSIRLRKGDLDVEVTTCERNENTKNRNLPGE